MPRAYSFLAAGGLTEMPNPHGLPVFLVREQGQARFERQPARSHEEAVRKFIRYAAIKSGKVVEVLKDGQDPEIDEPVIFKTIGKPCVTIK